MTEKAINWTSPATDATLKQVRLTLYGEHQNGGMTLFFNSGSAAAKMYNELVNSPPENPHHLRRNRFPCVNTNKRERLPSAEALCISAENPKLLHIESVKPEVLERVDKALKHLFGEGMPRQVVIHLANEIVAEVERV